MSEKTASSLPKVLFVDDEANILSALTRLMIDEPFEVFTAGSGKEGLQVLKHGNGVAVIVSDQRMPEMSGAEFLEKAREIAPDSVRIILTGYADIQAAVDAINKGGAYRYIAKPWKDEDLIQVVHEAVARYALLQENKRLTEIVHRQNAELKQWSAQLEQMVQQQTIEIQKKNGELNGFNDRLRKNFRDSIHAFAGLLELRDKSAMSHSRNVADVAACVARDMALPPEEAETITVAAILHDIGKIGVADVLLVKDIDAMSGDEQKTYKLHPVRGQAAIDGVEDLRKAGVIIRHHHEAFNGTGYPDAVRGEDIPLGSRIIAVADLFDRAFSRASGANGIEQAWNRVGQEAGKKLDPRICRIAEKPIKDKYSAVAPKTGLEEREMALVSLAAGMVVSRDVKSGTGILLLSKGTTLDQKNILALKRYEQVDPLPSGVFIWNRK